MLLKMRLPFVDVSRVLHALRYFFHYLRGVRQAMRSRRELAMMDARMLADIGLSRAEAEAEINRKPWDIASR
jgi:uncharacterized protein YjiS (DUF1127 family)